MARWFCVLGALAVGLGCGDDDTVVCTPGTTITCACPVTVPVTGTLICNAAGTGYGDCLCDDVDAGVPPLPDSGPPPPPPDAGMGCDVTLGESFFFDTCTGQGICDCAPQECSTVGCSICVAPGACQPVLPRRYRISPLAAEVPTTTPAGESWDIGGGAPDLYATVAVDGVTVIAMTPIAPDSFSVEWTGVFGDATLVAGSQIEVNVLDEDVSDDDAAFLCEWTATPEQLRARVLTCTGDLGTFVAVVTAL